MRWEAQSGEEDYDLQPEEQTWDLGGNDENINPGAASLRNGLEEEWKLDQQQATPRPLPVYSPGEEEWHLDGRDCASVPDTPGVEAEEWDLGRETTSAPASPGSLMWHHLGGESHHAYPRGQPRHSFDDWDLGQENRSPRVRPDAEVAYDLPYAPAFTPEPQPAMGARRSY